MWRVDASWSAAILVGGQARRLRGEAKPRLAIGGRTVLERQAAMLATLGIRPTLIARHPDSYADLTWPVTRDLLDAGALGALYTALATATTTWVLVLAGDMPFVSAALVRHLLDVRDDWDAIVPRTGDQWHPLCALYARRVAPELGAVLDSGERRITDAIARLRCRAIEGETLAALDPDDAVLTNVNTPDDLRRAVARAVHER